LSPVSPARRRQAAALCCQPCPAAWPTLRWAGAPWSCRR
jgi:hypothetical protein